MCASPEPTEAPVTAMPRAPETPPPLGPDVDARPALLGGPAAVTLPLPPWPQHDEGERRHLEEVLEHGSWWRNTGTQVRRFEADFAAAHGAARGLAATNGTHALELALRVLDVGPGDEVIVPALTFVATAMPVFTLGARPVPVDVRRDTWCLDVDAVRAAVSPATRAVLPVHFAGHPVDMDALGALCRERGLVLVEDACHAHGARWRDRPVGGLGAMAAFSFQNFKLLTAGEGGMLLFRDEELWRRAQVVANCGRPPEAPGYAHDVLGSNFRMSEFQGAVLNAQLGRMEELAVRREANAGRLARRLAEVPGVRLQGRDPRVGRHAHYMVVFTLDPDAFAGVGRDRLVAALVAEGVPAQVMYPRIQDTGHFAPNLRRVGADPESLPACPVAAELAARGVWLHHRVLLGEGELVDQVAAAIAKLQCRAKDLAAEGAAV